MKKYFSIVLWTVLASLVFVSCSDDEADEVKELTPVVNMEMNEYLLEIPSKGGSFTVPFSVDQLIPNVEATAETKANWITDFKIELGKEESTVTFMVEEHTGTAPRDTKVKVYYAGTFDSFILKQDAPVDWGNVKIEINDCTDGKVIYTVNPENKNLTYVSQVVEKTVFDQFENDEAYYQDDLKSFKETAIAKNMSLAKYLKTILQQGSVQAPVVGLKPGVTYYAYAYGLDTKGNRLTSIYKQEFTTYALKLEDYNFDLSFDIEGSVVDMHVVPQDNETFYMFDVAPAGTATQDLIKGMESYIDRYIKGYTQLGVSLEEAVKLFAKKGATSYLYNGQLEEDKDYIGYAMAITPTGNIKSNVVTKAFRTGNNQSLNKISLALSEIGAYTATVNITATTNDLYIVGFDNTENWQGKSNDEILKALVAGYDWKTQDYRGSAVHKMKGLLPETAYSVFAFGYAGGTATTKLVRIDFITSKAEETQSPTAATISLSYDKYFLGDDLIKAYPDKFDNTFAGLAVVKVNATVTNSDNYLYQIYNGDKTGVADSEFLKSLEVDAEGWLPSCAFTPPVDQVVTLAGVAYDADGVPSKVFKKAVTFTKEGASPASEYYQ